jgi:CubicO group peptidase (beta-lactamase class C family)
VLGDGAYASMGGMQVSARDYIRYVNFVLDGWRTSADSPYAAMIARATRRELAQPTSFPRMRGADLDEASCPASLAYSYGMHVVTDCRFTNAMTHSGGLPGYGSNVLFLPQHDAAVFLFVNRTYAPAAAAVRKIAARLADDGVLVSARAAVSPAFTTIGDAIGKMIAAGNVDAVPSVIANNLYADRDLVKRNLELRQLLERLGPCSQQPTHSPTHNLAGAFNYSCERGTLRAEVLLAPTATPQLQQLEFSVR